MTFRFPRFSFSFTNPFATIRDLRSELANARFENECSADAINFLRGKRDYQDRRIAALGEALIQADQAIDAFMDDRDELKADIADLADAQTELVNYGIASTAAIVELRREAQEQAAEIVETVAYLKAVEARLAASGITIEDNGECGPVVVVNQEAFMAAVRGANHVQGPDIRLAA